MGDAGLDADGAVDQGGQRADHGVGADTGGAAQAGAGLDAGVGVDLDRGVDPGRGGVDDGDAGQHVGLEQAAAGLGLDRGEVDPVVDPHRHREVVGEMGGDRVAGLAQGREDVGQVVLALGVVVGEAGQGGGQRRRVEGVGAGVDLADRQLRGVGVAGGFGLDHALDLARGGADDAAVGGGVVELDRQHRRRRRRGGVGLEQAGDRRRPRAAARRRRGRARSRPPRSAPGRRGSRRRCRRARAARPSRRPRGGPRRGPCPGETIAATRPAPASRAARIGQATIARPQTGCSIFGRRGTHSRALPRRHDENQGGAHWRIVLVTGPGAPLPEAVAQQIAPAIRRVGAGASGRGAPGPQSARRELDRRRWRVRRLASRGLCRRERSR